MSVAGAQMADRNYQSLDAAARRQNSPDEVVSTSGEGGGAGEGGGVWSPRAGASPGPPPPGASESPVTQYVPAAVDEDEPPLPPPPRRGGLLGCLSCCFRGAGETADHGLADGPSTPRPLYIPPAPHVGKPFIPPLSEGDTGKKTLVLDLDETLVHSSFKPVPNPDYIIPVEIDGKARPCRLRRG